MQFFSDEFMLIASLLTLVGVVAGALLHHDCTGKRDWLRLMFAVPLAFLSYYYWLFLLLPDVTPPFQSLLLGIFRPSQISFYLVLLVYLERETIARIAINLRAKWK